MAGGQENEEAEMASKASTTSSDGVGTEEPRSPFDVRGPGAVIEGFCGGIRSSLLEKGVTGIRWWVKDSRLGFRLQPDHLLPFEIWVAQRAAHSSSRGYRSSDTATVSHEGSHKEELDEPTREFLVATAEAILGAVDDNVLHAIGEYADWQKSLSSISIPLLVQRGFRRAAFYSINDDQSTLAELKKQVTVLVPSPEETREFNAQWETSETDAMVFVCIAQDAATASRVHELLPKIRRPNDKPSASEIEEIGMLLGVPRCCTGQWLAVVEQSGKKPEHISIARLMMERSQNGNQITTYSPLTNLLGAKFHCLCFFEYVPCCPRCEATLINNHKMLMELYPDRQRKAILSILCSSYLVWPDGAISPFRAKRINETEFEVTDFGVRLWPETMEVRFSKWVRDNRPARRRVVAHMDRLRFHRGRWEERVEGRWQALVDRTKGWFWKASPYVVLVTEDKT